MSNLAQSLNFMMEGVNKGLGFTVVADNQPMGINEFLHTDHHNYVATATIFGQQVILHKDIRTRKTFLLSLTNKKLAVYNTESATWV